MSSDSTIRLIGAMGTLAIIFLGLSLILRGFLGGPFGGRAFSGSPVGLGRGALGRTVSTLLSFAVAFKFVFEAYVLKVYPYGTMMAIAFIVLLAMVLVPAIETLVSIAALTLFLMSNTAVFGNNALMTFLGLLVVYAGLRWILGR